MSDNVVPLRGLIGETMFGEPVPEIVEMLERALDDARSGCVRSCAIAYTIEVGDPKPSSKTAWHFETLYFPHLWLAVSSLVQRLQALV